MNNLIRIIKDFPFYLWSGWAAIASLFLLIACWDYGHQIYGDLILPSPKETFITLYGILNDAEMIDNIVITIKRALMGFALSLIIGTVLGLISGVFLTISMMSRPIITVLMGMPPIAWIVLSMIWFGLSDNSIIFTVFIASFPIVFIGALQGTRTLENNLKEMVDSFQLNLINKLTDLYFPHLFSYIFPAWVSALGMSWKIVIMAELLSSNTGIGSSLAIARSQLDTTTALALVLIMIGLLLIIEYLFLEILKKEIESWRD